MPGKFVVKKGPTGKFRFSLVAINGQIVASSEAYETKAKALSGIRAIKRLAGDAEIEDQTTQAWAKQQEQARVAARSGGRRAPATRKAPGTRAPASKTTATERATRRRTTAGASPGGTSA